MPANSLLVEDVRRFDALCETIALEKYPQLRNGRPIRLGISLQTPQWRTRGGEQKCFSFTALNQPVAKSPTAGILEVSRE
jgi:hypothetical protein